MRLVLPLVALAALALYATMLLWSLPHLTALTGGLAMFDMRPSGYSMEEAGAILAALGDAGRAFYLGTQHRLDSAFPVLEAAALSLAFWRLFPRPLALPLIAVSIAGGMFDLLENRAVAVLLHAGPGGIDSAMVATASRWTLLKSLAITLALSALLIGLAVAAWRRWR